MKNKAKKILANLEISTNKAKIMEKALIECPFCEEIFFLRHKPTRTKRMGEETTATKIWKPRSRWMSGN